MNVYYTQSAQETIALGVEFAALLRKKDVVILEGELGGGKTTFVTGILRGLGYTKGARSPSFTLMREYETKKMTVFHADVYRLGNDELFGWGLSDYLYSDRGVCVVEWGAQLVNELPGYFLLEFVYRGETKRKISFSLIGAAAARKQKAALFGKDLRK